MIILISSNSCWNLFKFRNGLIKALNNKKNKIIIVAPFDNYLKKISNKNILYIPINIKKNNKSPLSDLLCFIKYLYIIYKYQPHYALTFTIKPNIYCSLAAVFSKTKIINNITGLGSVFIKDNYFSKIIFQIYKLAFKNSYKVVFQNKYDMKLFIQKNISYKKNSVLIPGSGINIQEFEKYENKYPTRKNEFTFLYSGRLINDKGIREFIEAAKIVKKNSRKKLSFIVMGFYDNLNPNKINFNYFESFIKDRTIQYVGFKKNPLSILNTSNCVVLPSYREGLSRTLLESMALKKLIIASNVPGCKDLIIENSNGYLCKPRDSKDLSKKMMKVLGLKKNKLVEMGKVSKDLIKNNYSEEIIINNFLKLL